MSESNANSSSNEAEEPDSAPNLTPGQTAGQTPGQPGDKANGAGATGSAGSSQPNPLRDSVTASAKLAGANADGDAKPPEDANPVVTTIGAPDADEPRLQEKVKTLLVGKPHDLGDKSVYTHLTLAAFLAWVGLGADGLSSSCYGPAEAFVTLGDEHRFLAVFLSLMTIVTVFVISACYRHIVEEFPSGGGGYLVASKMLGKYVGAISGSALLVDYVLTITTSIAAAGDALFGIFPFDAKWMVAWKIEFEVLLVVLLIVVNLRGIKESVKVLLPIFMTFLITHIILIGGSLTMHASGLGEVARHVADEVRDNWHVGEMISSADGTAITALGSLGMLALLLRAYTLGAGTYTGIEAVSNSMSVMQEPRVATGKRTMTYMAVSLSLTAGGLMLAYLLLDVRHIEGEGVTMNQKLAQNFVADIHLSEGWGNTFVWVTILFEALLLVVAAQAGFIGGPRLLANMAHDSWMPHWFANLSERLATHNGIVLMGAAALAALLFTQGSVSMLLIMYSINVFVTFTLSMVGMCMHWWVRRKRHPLWRRRFALFTVGGVMCAAILCVTIFEKFWEGGWVTLAVTGVLVLVCLATRRHYDTVITKLRRLDETLDQLPSAPGVAPPDVNPKLPTAAILVGGYSGLGVHTLLNAVRFAPGHFKNMIFISVAVVDSGNFKGAAEVEELKRYTEDALSQYVDYARRQGMPSTSYMSVGTEAVHELELLCLQIAKQYPKIVFFAGQLLFEQDTWFHRLLHNQTAYSLQRRLQWVGLPMVILPTRVR